MRTERNGHINQRNENKLLPGQDRSPRHPAQQGHRSARNQQAPTQRQGDQTQRPRGIFRHAVRFPFEPILTRLLSAVNQIYGSSDYM